MSRSAPPGFPQLDVSQAPAATAWLRRVAHPISATARGKVVEILRARGRVRGAAEFHVG